MTHARRRPRPQLLHAAALLAALLVLAAPLARAQPEAAQPAPVRPEAAAPAPARPDTPKADITVRHFDLTLAGAPAGSMVETITRTEQEIRTRSEMTLTVRRGATAIRIRQETEFVETPRFEPVRASALSELGAGPIRTTMTFAPEGIDLSTEQQGRTTTSRAPKPEGVWLTPQGARDYTARRLRAGATTIKLRTLDPSAGAEPLTLERTAITPATLELQGAEGPVTVEGYWCDSRSSLEPDLVSREFLTAQGDVLRTDSTIGDLALRMEHRPGRTSAPEIDPARAPEMMVSTFVKPDRPIQRPRELDLGVYVLRVKDIAPGEASPLASLTSAAGQRVEMLPDGAVRLTVRAAAADALLTEEPPKPEDLASTAFCDLEDAEVRTLANSATGSDPAALAERLRRVVYEHIRDKNLGTAFGTASETARSRAGDCTEHAVLLCALLRARDIPARVVSGLIYADEFAGARHVFGYHMWTRARLQTPAGPRWIDLDATLPGPRAFDATHIALQEPDLRDGKAMTSLAGLVRVLGRLEIRVETP